MTQSSYNTKIYLKHLTGNEHKKLQWIYKSGIGSTKRRDNEIIIDKSERIRHITMVYGSSKACKWGNINIQQFKRLIII